MNSFLHDTAADILRKYKNHLHELYIIFPNKRTKIFFNKAFAEELGEVHWAVRSDTFKSFMRRNSDLTELDKLSLIHHLFLIYKDLAKEIQKDHLTDFTSFYRLGELILNDFNEIDNWLADPKRIFLNISDIHDIDTVFETLTDEQKDLVRQFWTQFREGKPSAEKDKFLQIRAVLPELYLRFTAFLESKKIGYAGLIYRRTAQNFETKNFFSGQFKRCIFVGFNALNGAEELVFRKFRLSEKTDFYWDTDAYYHNDPKQEAGDFPRKNFKNLDIRNYPIPANFEQPKTVKLIGMPMQVGQAKLAGTLLRQAIQTSEPEQIAVVLADEHLLFPVLYAVPPEIDSINVTMGYPMKSTPVYSLIDLYVKMLRNAERKHTGDFYYKDVIALLKHPAVEEASRGEARLAVEKIEAEKRGFVNPNLLSGYRRPIMNQLFTRLPEDNIQEGLLENLLNILYEIFDKRKDESTGKTVKTIENEFVHKAYTHIKRFADVLDQSGMKLGLKLLTDLLLQTLNAEQIPFTGKAQKGIQIMGVLETRNLDYKHVIVLGLNEGQFPSVSVSPSFISENMRFVFGLPQIRHKDSVFAYFFYRLLQRAEHITLVYNSIVNDKNAGEISRFVRQLKEESKHTIIEEQYTQELIPEKPKEIYIPKSDATLKKLDSYLIQNGQSERAFSASAINSYIDCSLQFYFKYIAGIKALESVEEDVSHAALGTILHRTVELLYKNQILQKKSNRVEKSDFKALRAEVETCMEQAFAEQYRTQEQTNFVTEGNQIIIKEVVINYVRKILNADEAYAPFEIANLEDDKSFVHEIEFEVNGKLMKTMLAGTIDRTDTKNGTVRVIDYKTGTVTKTFKAFSDLFGKETKFRNKNVVQIFLYGYLYKKKFSEHLRVQPAIYNVREMHSSDFNPNIAQKIGRDSLEITPETFDLLLPDYLANLADKISDIFHPDIPFQQAENHDVCEYCDYKNICSR